MFRQALIDVFGTEGAAATYPFSGRTDARIVLDLMAGFLPEHEVLARLPLMRERYLAELERVLDRGGMRLLPGLPDLLEDLAARPDVTLGLLTGNWEAGARTKLSRFDLNRFFPFGAFGSDATDRDDLPPVALERAARHAGRTFRPEEALVIGDSVHDVSCAHAHGISVLAVATGRTSAEELRAAGADQVVGDLTEWSYAAFAPLSTG